MPDLTDEAKKEIADAVAIVAADQNSKRLREIHSQMFPPSPETDPPKDGEPSAPPKKDEPPEGDKPKRSSIWAVGSSDD